MRETDEISNKLVQDMLSGDAHKIWSDGYFELVDTVRFSDSNIIDYYMIRCNHCKILYKVEERMYHYIWWNWQAIKVK